MPEPLTNCNNCNHEFELRKLNCPECNEVKCPFLYKYTRFNENSLSILINKELWFPSVASLNDPFEFQIVLTETTIDGLEINKEEFQTAISLMKQYGVLSLSQIDNNILMWSHYADSHTGLCIQFERTNSNELGAGKHCIPIIYSDQLPMFKPLDLEKAGSVSKSMTTKSKLWSYEQEWRMLSLKSNQLHPLPGKITGVIFGCKMNHQNRLTVSNILGDTVNYFEAVQSEDTFSVRINPVSYPTLLSGEDK